MEWRSAHYLWKTADYRSQSAPLTPLRVKPLLLFSERERRGEQRAKLVIVAIFTAIFYLLFWKWGFLVWSAGGVTLIVAVPLVLSSFAVMNKTGELAVICLIFLSLTAVGLPVYRKVQEKNRHLEELRKQRRLTELRAPPAATPAPTSRGN